MKTAEQLAAENQSIRDLLARGVETELRAIPGVVHVSVGLKEKDGKITDQLCVRVYVATKKDRSDLPAGQVIAAAIQGVATDVNVVDTYGFLADHSRYRPIKGGIAISNRIVDQNESGTGTQLSRGTLGCIAIDNTDKAPVLLSNWHVLAANFGGAGDKVFQPPPSSVPSVSLIDLPLRPTDETDKVGVIRRTVISQKVDGAIAAIDVSSCCHCCGIHFSNELNGLSVSGRPGRNTIVGDASALGGMPVFKVGKSTLRTEGVVVDPNHPSFSITKDGTTYTFTGQISIRNVDNTKPFGDHGDSGSVIINLENKIVGLLFAGNATTSLANHIADVFKELKIRIAYSPDVLVTAGAGLAEVPEPIHEAPVPEPYRAFRERLERHESTAYLIELGQCHREEVVRLVNHCRPVMVAWQRAQGPAWLATLMGRVRDGRSDLPDQIQGGTLAQALIRMKASLEENGSDSLRASLQSAEADHVLGACRTRGDLDEIVAFLVSGTLRAKDH